MQRYETFPKKKVFLLEKSEKSAFFLIYHKYYKISIIVNAI